MSEHWVTVQIERPADYNDVCDELVAEDAMLSVEQRGWKWRYAPAPLPSPPRDSPEPLTRRTK